MASTAHPLALFNTAVELADPVKNGIVRISSKDGSKFFGGTGVIIDARLDDPKDKNSKAWICILTADHNLITKDGKLSPKIEVGTGNGKEFDFDDVKAFRGPGSVDLGMVAFRVNSYATFKSELPYGKELTLPKIGSVDKGADLILGGFGNTNDPRGQASRQSYTVMSEFGTLRVASDKAFAVDVDYKRGSYQFNAIQGKLSFTVEKDVVKAGTAFVLNGDSGGPTFAKDGDSLKLVGIHSGSNPDKDLIPAGSTWSDVSISSYKKWIMTTCNSVPEPPPLAAALAALGFFALGRMRRRRS